MASLDGATGLPAVTLLLLAIAMEPQFHPPVCFAPFGSVAKARIAQSFTKLWDSHWRRTFLGTTRTSLFGRLWLKLWDSQFLFEAINGQILKTLFPTSLLASLGNPRENATESLPIGQQCNPFNIFNFSPTALSVGFSSYRHCGFCVYGAPNGTAPRRICRI